MRSHHFALASSVAIFSCGTRAPVPSAPPDSTPIPSVLARVTTPNDAAASSADAAAEGSVDATAAEPVAGPTDAGRAVSTEAPRGMLLVPGGPFTMGADKGGEEDEHPAHTVTLAAFWLDRTEVTNEAYAECVKAKACGEKDIHIASRAHAGPDKSFDGPKQPVIGVRWDDAKAYCGWRGGRLPSEAEWEKAARGDDGRRFPWGNDPPDKTVHGVFGRAFGRDPTENVGSYPKGRGPYGHDDLAGNVWEWVDDEYDPFAYRRPTASTGKAGTCKEILETLASLRNSGRQGFTGSNPIPSECERVLRGGAFNYPPEGLRAMNRVHHPGRFRLVMSGFRCAKDAAGAEPRDR